MLSLSKYTSLGSALRDRVTQYQDNVALIEADRDRENVRLTYGEFSKASKRVASMLQHHKATAEDRCAILMSNQSKWLISATGVFFVGGQLVPVDYKLTAQEQARLIRHSGAKFLFVEWPIWFHLRNELKDLTVFVSEVPESETITPALRWEAYSGYDYDFVERSKEDVACIVYSSGTGGKPKGCMLTHGNYLAQAQVLGDMFPIDESDRYFSILPTNHAIDFMCGYFLPLQFGAAVVHQRTLRPEFLSSTMKRYGITHMALVPMVLKALEKKIRDKIAMLPSWKRAFVQALMVLNEVTTRKSPKHGFSSKILKPIHQEFGGKLRTIFAGGAFVEPETAAFFYRLGIPVAIGYGLTEAGTVLTVNTLKPFRSDTVGQPISGVKLELHEKNELGHGEVWVKGPTIMKGYLDEPELTNEAILDGWLRTGDMGYMDSSGHLRLVGRAKNMIVTEGGKNIYPEDVESSFHDLEGCEEHCIFASNFLFKGEELTTNKLVIVTRPSKDASPEEIVERIRERNRKVADYKRVGACIVWDQDFPRTASMKIKRSVLAKALSSGRGEKWDLT